MIEIVLLHLLEFVVGNFLFKILVILRYFAVFARLFLLAYLTRTRLKLEGFAATVEFLAALGRLHSPEQNLSYYRISLNIYLSQ